MDLNEYTDRSVRVVTISGRLDGNTSAELEETLIPRMKDEAAVVVDMQHVQYVSSAGLRVLLKTAKVARSSENRLALSALAPQVQEVFDISGFTAIFRIYDNSRAATDALLASDASPG